MSNLEKYDYQISWSPDDNEYVGLCSQFPGLSYLASNKQDALSGIIDVVKNTIEVLNEEGIPVPEVPAACSQSDGNSSERND